MVGHLIVAGFEANDISLVDVLIEGDGVAVCSVYFPNLLLQLNEVYNRVSVHGK